MQHLSANRVAPVRISQIQWPLIASEDRPRTKGWQCKHLITASDSQTGRQADRQTCGWEAAVWQTCQAILKFLTHCPWSGASNGNECAHHQRATMLIIIIIVNVIIVIANSDKVVCEAALSVYQLWLSRVYIHIVQLRPGMLHMANSHATDRC